MVIPAYPLLLYDIRRASRSHMRDRDRPSNRAGAYARAVFEVLVGASTNTPSFGSTGYCISARWCR